MNIGTPVFPPALPKIMLSMWRETASEEDLKMDQTHRLTPEERARITEIQDSLIGRYVAQKEALYKGQKARAREIEHEINELHRKIEEIKEWARV